MAKATKQDILDVIKEAEEFTEGKSVTAGEVDDLWGELVIQVKRSDDDFEKARLVVRTNELVRACVAVGHNFNTSARDDLIGMKAIFKFVNAVESYTGINVDTKGLESIPQAIHRRLQRIGSELIDNCRALGSGTN